MAFAMQHLNGDKLCAIDIETTGVKPGINDILTICILPATNWLQIDKSINPFILEMIPKRPHNIDDQAMGVNRLQLCEIMARGVDPYRGADLFVEWFERLKIAPNKRIAPLACNWVFENGFLIDWLGYETFNMCFDARYRDVMVAALFANDRANWLDTPYPYPKVNLNYLCNQLKIERRSKHDAVDDARVTLEIYRKQIEDLQ